MEGFIMKKVFVAFFILFVNLFVFAQSEDDFEIIQNSAGKITITDYVGNVRDIVIPEKINGIDVSEIAAGAFNGRRNKNQYGNLVEKHKDMVLLTSVAMPNSVLKIGAGAFANNEISKIKFRTGLMEIGQSAFSNNKMTSLIIGNNLKVIGEGAFDLNQITTINLPNSLTSIGTNAFDHNPIQTVILGTGIKNFGLYALGAGIDTSILVSVNIGDNVNIHNLSGLDRGFINYYNSQNKRRGTYEKNGRIWSRR
jgi:hypothetical protein